MKKKKQTKTKTQKQMLNDLWERERLLAIYGDRTRWEVISSIAEEERTVEEVNRRIKALRAEVEKALEDL